MDLFAVARIAVRALARNKMRSSLTMLGIIIGVGAVIAMVGVGQGAQQAVQTQIASMGSNLLMIQSGSVNRGGLMMGWGPVSYTHLRAHETVLDLVCRLLLEKKK